MATQRVFRSLAMALAIASIVGAASLMDTKYSIKIFNATIQEDDGAIVAFLCLSIAFDVLLLLGISMNRKVLVSIYLHYVLILCILVAAALVIFGIVVGYFLIVGVHHVASEKLGDRAAYDIMSVMTEIGLFILSAILAVVSAVYFLVAYILKGAMREMERIQQNECLFNA